MICSGTLAVCWPPSPGRRSSMPNCCSATCSVSAARCCVHAASRSSRRTTRRVSRSCCSGALPANRSPTSPGDAPSGRSTWPWAMAILVPRPETELLVEAALARLKDHPAPSILDLGTGSGAVALAIAAELPAATVTGVDASIAALETARDNARDCGLQRVRFESVTGTTPAPASASTPSSPTPPTSPPPIPTCRHSHMNRPQRSSPARPVSRRCPRSSPARPGHLVPGGHLLLEHGAEQGPAVRAACAAAGLEGDRDAQGPGRP